MLCLCVAVLLVLGCSPTGPAPIEFVVPTAIREVSASDNEPAESNVQATETSSSPESGLTVNETIKTETITASGWNLLNISLGGRILTPTSSHNSVLWIAPAGLGSGLYFYDLASGESKRLAEPKEIGGCICRGYRRGDWIAMVEAQPGDTWWEISVLSLASAEKTLIGRTDDPATLRSLRPGEFAVNADGWVAWKDIATDEESNVIETIGLRSIITDAVSEIIRVRSPARIGRLEMSGNWVVWNLISEGDQNARGDIFGYNLESRSLVPIDDTGRAWSPAVWDTNVVWKVADGPFADGDVFLYDLVRRQGQLITDTGQVSDVDVGSNFVVWSSGLAGAVTRHDMTTGIEEIIGRGSASQLSAESNTIVWLYDNEPGTLQIAWLP